ncbi:heparan-alpha-glucosaminide N-acetyltransferase domain-containing protein [Zafaria sp. Z1313]|uniref:heparan-alpha-glucosaminide N-acetyltransferase domain-containing protein n=1 Tax=unclassified Zafaria TaxID=2828765 RepID=UPI002E7A3F82|nr:heparan-alpha-glucosaminide N-acetyltransferase domain-containing protein [Zafaria sp. J156]MEE1621961.1 heparan-alpha-glucosaminide N-acetyltransferase domain-containing protein [Zafaria sp. J156]
MTKSTTPDAAGSRSGARARIPGVDAARGLALLGMMATHIVPLSAPDFAGTGAGGIPGASTDGSLEPTWAAVLFAGRASALFAVLAGVGLALLTGGAAGRRGPRLAATRRGVAVRALLIAVLGFGTGMLDTHIAVILVHYGLLFLLAIPFLGLSARALSAWAAGWLVLSPVLLFVLLPLVRAAVSPPDVGGSPVFADLLRPATLAADLLVTGYYPVVVWTGFVLLGLAVGRLELNRPPVALGLLVAGAAAALGARAASAVLTASAAAQESLRGAAGIDAAGLRLGLATGQGLGGIEDSPWWFAVAAPHTGSPLDVLHVAGTAVAVLGACQLACLALSALLGGVGEALLWPLTGAGAATLTLYSAHLVALDVFSGATAAMPRVELYAWYAVVALLAGIAVKWAGTRGPLEAAVHAAARAAAGSGRS